MRRLPLRSPPRVRGKVCHTMAEAKGLGITPAYAGKRCRPPHQAPAVWDHPRVCGEKWQNRVNQLLVRGSPPRMRGKGRRNHPVIFVDGITPAYAGKSHPLFIQQRASRDHPRVCGEKPQPATHSAAPPGSPPRMRGKDEQTTGKNENARITPAYAGKRSQGVAALQLGWDHPRVCGEKPHLTPAIDRSKGSPPRMRGKVAPMRPRIAPPGITPAYAGKRLQNDKGNIYGRDHPRVCGEKRTTAGRSSGACAATSNAIGMVTSALYRSAMSYTKEHSCPTCTNPSPGAHPSATMTAWASPYRQACTVGHTGAGAEQQHRNARHIIHGCFLRAGWSSGQGRRLCRGQCPDTASPGTLPGRSPAGCPHRSPPAM